MVLDDTIAAISTAPGTGAIAIVRMSGPLAWQITDKIFFSSAKNGKESAAILKSHTAVHGFLKDEGAIVDEVVVVAFKGPHSYTGEDLVEVSCHGGSVVTNEVLSLCLKHGARLARQGEFTERAFLHGRIDLTQAEAVLDIIQAKTGRQSRFALSALTGHVGEQIQQVRQELIELMSRIVAGIDFPEEVGEMSLSDVDAIVARSRAKLQQLSNTARSGRFLREGLKVAIVGKPNAGKSSLLNQLLQFERAIVTDTPGTTRDSIEEILDLNGIPIILIDTAGIRKSDDAVELIGMERTRRAIAEADLVLLVTDLTSGWTVHDQAVKDLLSAKPCILLSNKVDLLPEYQLPASEDGQERDLCVDSGRSTDGDRDHLLCRLTISAKTGAGLHRLKGMVENWVFQDQPATDAGGSLNARQAELCEKAIRSLKLVEETSRNKMPQDCLATDLKHSIDSLSEICGESVSEEVITNVFAKFCIGK